MSFLCSLKTIIEPAKPYIAPHRPHQPWFDEAPRACFKKRGTKLMEACEHCVRYPDCFFLLSCPNYRECYAEMPEMYEHMLQQDMKAMYQDYLEKGVTNR